MAKTDWGGDLKNGWFVDFFFKMKHLLRYNSREVKVGRNTQDTRPEPECVTHTSHSGAYHSANQKEETRGKARARERGKRGAKTLERTRSTFFSSRLASAHTAVCHS